MTKICYKKSERFQKNKKTIQQAVDISKTHMTPKLSPLFMPRPPLTTTEAAPRSGRSDLLNSWKSHVWCELENHHGSSYFHNSWGFHNIRTGCVKKILLSGVTKELDTLKKGTNLSDKLRGASSGGFSCRGGLLWCGTSSGCCCLESCCSHSHDLRIRFK